MNMGNWGSGFITIINYSSIAEAALEDDTLITENGFNILTESGMELLVETA